MEFFQIEIFSDKSKIHFVSFKRNPAVIFPIMRKLLFYISRQIYRF